jgi:hypothetical protein
LEDEVGKMCTRPPTKKTFKKKCAEKSALLTLRARWSIWCDAPGGFPTGCDKTCWHGRAQERISNVATPLLFWIAAGNCETHCNGSGNASVEGVSDAATLQLCGIAAGGCKELRDEVL